MRATPLSRTLFFLAGTIVIAAAPRFVSQEASGAIEGLITQSGSGRPIAGSGILLAGGANAGITAQEGQALLNRRAAEGSVMPEDLVEVARDGIPNFYNVNGPARGLRPVTVTDSSGHFTIRNLVPGLYTVRAERGGYFGAVKDAVASRNVWATVRVASQQTQSVRMSLSAGASVSGRVVDSQGVSIGRMGLELYTVVDGMSGIYHQYNPGFIDGGYGTSGGAYRINDLPAGEYVIRADPSLNPDGVVTIDRTSSVPVPGSAANIPTFHPSSSDVSMAAPFRLQAGEEAAGKDIQVIAGTVKKVSGRVVNSLPHVQERSTGSDLILDLLDMLAGTTRRGPQPQAGDAERAMLTLLPRNNDSLRSPPQILNYPRAVFSDAGRFEILGVIPPGSYDLYASIPDYPGFGLQDPQIQRWSFGRTSIVVGTGDLDNVRIDVSRGIAVTGQVTIDGRPPSRTDLKVALEPNDTAQQFPVLADASRGNRTVNANGAFEIPFVPAGRYRIQIGLPPTGPQYSRPPLVSIPMVYVEDVRQEGRSVYDEGFQVGLNPFSPMEIALKTNGAGVEGVVHDSGGRPLYGATVALIPSTSRRKNLALYKRIISDYAGHFSIVDIAPGDYILFAWEQQLDHSYENPEVLARYEMLGQNVTLVPGAKLFVNPTLIPRR